MKQLIGKTGERFLKKINRLGILKDDELQLCFAANEKNDPNMILGYFLYKPDLQSQFCPICSVPSTICAFPEEHEEFWFRSGLQLHDWQIDHLLCRKTDINGDPASTIVMLGGPGCGKSTFLAVAIGWLLCALNPGFINLTAAPTAKQNDAVKTEYDKWIIGTRGWEVFMADQPQVERPLFKYKFRNGAEHRIFTTAALSGGAKAAKRNLSLEGDVVAYDEAGIDEAFHESLRVLGGRTRGLRPDGTYRGLVYPNGEIYSPMYVISNPHQDNLEFDEFISVIAEMPTFSLSEIDINENKVLTSHQIDAVTQRMIASYLIMGGTEEDAMDALAGRQNYGDGEVFSSKSIKNVVSSSYNIEDFISSYLVGPQRTDSNFTFLLPRQKDHLYLLTCDPGANGAPKRNSPVIMLWDVTEANKPPLVGLYWGSPLAGTALYLETLAAWIREYHAYAYVDTTGPQAVLIDSKKLIGVEGWVIPVDTSGSYKATAQWIMQMAAQKGSFVLPTLPQPYTFERYLRRYRWKDDGLAQDLIIGIMLMTLWQYKTLGFNDAIEPEKEQDPRTVSNQRYVSHVRGRTIATR